MMSDGISRLDHVADYVDLHQGKGPQNPEYLIFRGHEMEISYDLSMQFSVLPRLSLLLLFNDADEEFPAQCTILFQKHAVFYLDPESLIMTGILLARKLRWNLTV